jgi:hypothetical protein
MAALVPGVAGADETVKPTPVWAERSIAVGNSTAALATGRTLRAIRLAASAVDRVDGHDRVVALHNLCLAWLIRGDGALAAGYCDAALHEVAETPRFEHIVRANIGMAQQNLLAEAADDIRD